MKTVFRSLVALLLAGLVAGCAAPYRQAPRLVSDSGVFEKTHYTAEIQAPDGVKMRFTVFQPQLKVGETAPVIIHAHGFALTRMESTFDMYAKLLFAGTTAIEAWNQGYWVVSIDQRGHGDSGGKISMHDEDKEVADIGRLIEWIRRNLAVTMVDNDPKIGMIGESYGGGIQLLASVQDKRIDAIVPITTWYDLEQALVPAGVPKSEWLMLLGIAGYGINPTHMDKDVAGGVLKELFLGKPQPKVRAQFRKNSLASYCEAGRYPKADALIIQGMRDVLFPLNHAVAMRQCFQAGGRDVRVIAAEHGHMMPVSQWHQGLPVWHLDAEIRCNDRQMDLQKIILDWFDMKLRDRKFVTDPVPFWCVTGDKAVDALLAPPPRIDMAVPKVTVGSGMTGMFEWAGKPMDRFFNLFVPAQVPADWDKPKNGFLRPARVPLMKVEGPTWLAGVPHVDIQLDDADRKGPVLFLRLASWKPGAGSYRVLSEQVTPVHGKGRHNVDLAAVRARLDKGEVVGLLVQGYSNQFRLSGSGWGTDGAISGVISLPLAGASVPAPEEEPVATVAKTAAVASAAPVPAKTPVVVPAAPAAVVPVEQPAVSPLAETDNEVAAGKAVSEVVPEAAPAAAPATTPEVAAEPVPAASTPPSTVAPEPEVDAPRPSLRKKR